MSFISDELANVLKSVYMKEESGKDEDVNCPSNLDKNDDASKAEKRSRKRKHKKHSSKSRSRDKKKHKKRKHKSRSRSESRSRSRSRSSERENSKSLRRRSVSSRSKSPEETGQPDFVLHTCKERTDEDDKGYSSEKEKNLLKSKKSDETVGAQKKAEEVAVSKSKPLEEKNQSCSVESVDDETVNLDNLLPAMKKERDRSHSKSESKEKVTDSKSKTSPSCSRSKSKSPERKSSKTLKERQTRSPSRDQNNKRKLRSSSKESVHYKISRSRSRSKSKLRSKSSSRSKSRSRSSSRKKSTKTRKSKSRSHSKGRSKKISSSRRSHSHSYSKSKSRSRSRTRSTKRRRSKSRSHSKEKNQKGRGSKSHSWSHSHSKSKSRSRSRTRSTKRRRSKSRSHSKERTRKGGGSKSHSRSHSHSKSRSRSPRHKRSRSRSRRRSPVFRHLQRHSPPRWRRGTGSFRRRSRSSSRSRRSHSRRRSYSRRKHSHSRSKSRSKSRVRSSRRSRSRSRVGRLHSRSRSRIRNRKSRSLSMGKRRRSRSRSYSRGRRSTSKDKNRSRSKTRSRSKSKEKPQSNKNLPAANTSTTVGNKVSNIIDKPVATSLSSQQVKVAQKAGGKTIAELTAFCKKLQEEKGDGKNSNEDGTKADSEQTETVPHHPFLVKEKPDITIPPVIFPVNMNKPSVPTVDPNKPLQEQFPVSCGSKHREKESVNDGAGIVADVDGSVNQPQQKNEVFAPPVTEKLDISDLVGKRMDAQRRLQSDPNDIEALLTLQEIQMKLQNWCQSNVKPGQYTGELVKNLLPKEDLQGGFQAWAKKDMFHNLAPVSGGIGMKLLQKMGWKPGQVIGKRGEGFAEPIALTVKIDRKGLSAGKEKANKKAAPTVLDLQGKHPVSALAEYCSKRKWQLPDYSLIFDHGPAHHKQFLFKVLVNGTEYQPAVVCGNKKQAKAQAAIFALKGLGLIPEDADMSAV